MAIIPTVRSTDLARSLEFYTRVLDFEFSGTSPAPGEIGFAVLTRAGYPLHISSHAGDGVPGQAIAVEVDDVDAVFVALQSRGWDPGSIESPVHRAPVDQTWGTREFYVDDPDGNVVRFIER